MYGWTKQRSPRVEEIFVNNTTNISLNPSRGIWKYFEFKLNFLKKYDYSEKAFIKINKVNKLKPDWYRPKLGEHVPGTSSGVETPKTTNDVNLMLSLASVIWFKPFL